MEPNEIGIEHSAMSEFRWNLDSALQVVSKVMMQKGIQKGTVNAKIDIRMCEMKTADGEIVKMMAIEPNIKVKVESKDQFKCMKIDNLYGTIDKDGNVIMGDNQISIDEYMEKKNQETA